MALLSEKERQEYFAFLGLGEYNVENIKKFQQMAMRPKDVDGDYGPLTDTALRHFYNVKKYTKNFDPVEFKCECNGKYCTGYPDYMKPCELEHIQLIRDHYGRPITVTSGLRCKGFNNITPGSSTNSPHLSGYAIDFYQKGVTDTADNRKAAIKYIKTLPNHNYTYGNGLDSNGVKRSASNMGNALHTDTVPGGNAPTSDQTTGLVVDGVMGPATVKQLQVFLGATVQDGVISGQNKNFKKYYPALTSVQFGSGGSFCVRLMQKWLGITQDGIWGPVTSEALQIKLGVEADKIFGPISAKALQRYLNEHEKADFPPEPTPTPTPTDYYNMIDVSEFQSAIDWIKVKNDGIQAVIVRCAGRGGEKGNIYNDSMFLNHIKGAYNAGLAVGIYFLTAAINAAEGKEEARYAINKWKEAGIPIDYPICIDSENITWKNKDGSKGYGRANDNKLSKAKRTEAIKAFAEECKRQGYPSMIYASTSWLYNQVDMNILAPLMDVWCAQYYSKCEYTGKYIIWQYSSEGHPNGTSGNIDMDKCYIQPKQIYPPSTPTPEPPTPSGYTGNYPSMDLVKSSSQVIADAIKFGLWIAGDDRFGYGRMGGAKYDGTVEHSITHSGGCHFCGSNSGKISRAKKAGLKNPEEWEYTYVCNTLVHACYAHAGVPSMLSVKGHAWWVSSYKNSKYWTEIKKPSKMSDLKAGDVCFSDSHCTMYIGNGKGVEAVSNGNAASSKSNWAKSIRTMNFDSTFKSVKNIFRFTGSVSTTALIKYGEVSDRVRDLQKYLIWYGLLPEGSDDHEFGDKTFAAVEQFQKDRGIAVDGVVGNETINAMKSYKR